MNLIMFDLDGTLIKSDTLDARCLIGAIEMISGIENIGSDWSYYKYVTDAGIVSEIINNKFNRPASDFELSAISSKLVELLQLEAKTNPDKFMPLPGAIELFNNLKTINNCGIAIATGSWKISALFKLCQAGFNATDIPMASSDDSYHREEIMKIAYERAKAKYSVRKFETTVYVGDGVWDLEATRKMGFHFIGIASGNDAATLKQGGASYILKDYGDKSTFFAILNEIVICNQPSHL